MFKSIPCRLMLIVGVFLSFPQFSSAQNSPHVPGELLIAPRAGVSEADLENQYKTHGGKKIKNLSQIKVHHIKVPEHALEAVEAALRKNPKVEFVEKNFIAEANLVPNDPGYGSQWHLPRVSAPGAWDITTGSPSVSVAVIDSGVDPYHPDLAAKLVAGYNFLGGSTSDTHDVYGHGTAVAGVIAADTNSGVGIAGLAWSSTIMPLVVVNSSNSATYSAIASAVTYAADHGAKVINMSLGGTSYSSTLQNAINYAWSKGLVIVAAAGNNSNSTYFYPAALNNVVAVSATDGSDNPASFTNFGSWITVSAPGTYIYTTTNGGGYGSWQGTSFASPQVAALAGLLFARNPVLTNQQVVDLIKNTADDLGAPAFDLYYGNGRINAYRALLAAPASGTPPPPPPPPPSSTLESYYLGITGQDLVGPGSQTSPNGNPDFHIQAQGLRGTPTRVRVTSDTGGIWEAPFNAAGNWIILPQYNGAGNADLWFEPWTSNSFHVKVWYSDGTTDEADAANQTTTPPPLPPSGDTTPPTVNSFSVQYDGAKWLSVNASASDTQTGVAKVELYVDGNLKATDTSAPYAFKLNTRPWPRGSHTVQVKAYDGAGNVGVSTSALVTMN